MESTPARPVGAGMAARFLIAFPLLTAVGLAMNEIPGWLLWAETSGPSRWTVLFFLLPSVVALTIPLALLVALAAAPREAGSPRGRFVMMVLLPLCLLEAALLFAVVPEANQRVRTALVMSLAGEASTMGEPPRGVREMSVSELRRASAQSRDGASFELHKRASMPVASLFLGMLGLGLASLLRGRLVKLALAVAAGAAWLGLLQLGASMGAAASVPAWLGAWTPAFAVAALAIAVSRHQRLPDSGS